MKRCKNCKAPLDKQATACPQCGTPVRSMKLRHKLLIALAVLLLVIGGIIGALFATGHGDLITGLPARIAAAFSGDANGAGRAGTDGTGGSSGGGAAGGGASPSETDFVLLGSGFTDRTIGSEDDARAAVEDAAPALGMEDADAELGTCASNEVMGNSYYRFAQEYEGITVYGRSVVVSADGSGEALGLTSNYAALGDIETEPAIAAEEAEERVIASVDRCPVDDVRGAHHLFALRHGPRSPHGKFLSSRAMARTATSYLRRRAASSRARLRAIRRRAGT